MSKYNEVRFSWALSREEEFRKDVTALCEEYGIALTDEALKNVVYECLEVLKFGYPAEYRLAELLTSDRASRDELVPDAMAIMKRHRVSFATREKGI